MADLDLHMGHYDADRDGYRDYDPIATVQSARDAYARELRGVRAAFAANGARAKHPEVFDNALARTAALDRYRRTPSGYAFQNPPDKLTPAGARKWAAKMWRFGVGPCQAHGNEYYSRCGADDAYGYAQDNARSHALAIWRAVGRVD